MTYKFVTYNRAVSIMSIPLDGAPCPLEALYSFIDPRPSVSGMSLCEAVRGICNKKESVSSLANLRSAITTTE